MKAVIQRVISASVAVDGKTISSIGKGLLVLIGIDKNDEPSDSTTIIKKILGAKLFDDESSGEGWKKNVKDIEGEVLCVSQFTLLATLSKGSKPDFHDSMSTIPSKAFYTSFLDEIKTAYSPDKIKDGQFGAMMQVSLTNDGPVTILLSSRDKSSKSGSGASTPTQADAARQKQKDMADAKAKKREEFEARVREKEKIKKERDEDWKRRNVTLEHGDEHKGIEGLKLE